MLDETSFPASEWLDGNYPDVSIMVKIPHRTLANCSIPQIGIDCFDLDMDLGLDLELDNTWDCNWIIRGKPGVPPGRTE